MYDRIDVTFIHYNTSYTLIFSSSVKRISVNTIEIALQIKT